MAISSFAWIFAACSRPWKISQRENKKQIGIYGSWMGAILLTDGLGGQDQELII